MRKCSMKNFGYRKFLRFSGIIAVVGLVLAACSTTKRLGEGETLYDGVKAINITMADSSPIPKAIAGEIEDQFNLTPNNPWPFKLFSPYHRSPFALGLWIWNAWPDTVKGLKGWIYRHMAKDPILISDVRANNRVELTEQMLANNGYFGSTAKYSVVYDKKNPKKAKMVYDVSLSKPYTFDSIMYLNDEKSQLANLIDSFARREPYLAKGQIFCVDSLSQARINIANRLRNRGYYYFQPDYIEFLADSLLNPKHIALKLSLADNLPGMVLQPYKVRDIYTIIERQNQRKPGTPDTISTSRGDLIVMRPGRVRPSTIEDCILFREGRLLTVRQMNTTQSRLSRLGMFSDIQIQPVPVDTSAASPEVDVYITCRFDRPMEVSLEVNATSKSNSYIGPGLVATLTHHNLFGGGEKLNFKLNGSYEWQTGSDRSSVFNSYEVGLSASLAFPRLLAPRFLSRTRRELNWTTFTLSGDVLNRPHYFMMVEYAMGMQYDWNFSRNVVNSFTPFKLSYTKLLRSTEAFDSIMALNPAVAQSFKSQFIPQMSYTYTYDRFLERARNNGINFQLSLTEAGNIFSGIYSLCGVHGEKKLFGTPFSQFVKGQAQLVYSRRLVPKKDVWLVSRLLVGAEHAYGNSSEVPYSEQFYIGGANSIRAFTVRSIGPGSYRAPKDAVNGYFDQTGTFKLEFNSEYRFPIVGILHGAAFVDAGNIWLLKEDPLRPGGQLNRRTFWRDIALGTGVGLRVDLGMMVIRGDLGYGLHVPYDNGTPHYFNIPFKKAFAFHLAIGYPF